MSKNIDYSLNLDNLKRINFDKYEKNFLFNVNGKQYETMRFVADILSPIINDYHYNDESINEFSISYKYENLSTVNEEESIDFFNDFLELKKFDQQEIDENHRKHYCEFFLQLGNINEYFSLQPKISSELTIDNIFDHLTIIQKIYSASNSTKNQQTIDKFKIFSNENLNQIIEFASSHFYELDKEKLKELDDSILIEIIQNEKLKLDEEDTLLHFIIEKYKSDERYSELFEVVIFNNVSENGLEEFINIFSIENLNSIIWRSICERLLSPNEIVKNKRYINQYNKKYEINEIIEIEYKEGEEFKGIMNYLTQKSGGNIHDNETIKISSNSIRNNNHPKNVVDYKKNNIYHSEDEQNINICFDFKEKSIQMTNYSIKSYNGTENYGHLRNWVIEVSNDKKRWEIVDQHDNDSILRNQNAVITFSTKQTYKFYRYIQLRQTGTSWNNGNNHYYLYFNCFEIYGKLMQPKSSSDKLSLTNLSTE